ncbi:hypothetical protein BT93_F3088 [Corymbia citriodora subsp. variegata]|nr:hypothetical protein BT93_F3088 [Corymbia citriodora subsp. variegata]
MIGIARLAMSRIGIHMAAGHIEGCRLTAGHIEGCRLTTGELRCVERMYGDQGAEVVEQVTEDPARVLPLVLSRLQQKHDEWVACRADARKVWKKAFAEHHRRSMAGKDTNTTAVKARGDAGSGTLCPPMEAGEEAPEASEQAEEKFFGKTMLWWAREVQRGKPIAA